MAYDEYYYFKAIRSYRGWTSMIQKIFKHNDNLKTFEVSDRDGMYAGRFVLIDENTGKLTMNDFNQGKEMSVKDIFKNIGFRCGSIFCITPIR